MRRRISQGKRIYKRTRPLSPKRTHLRPLFYYLNLYLESFIPKFGGVSAVILGVLIGAVMKIILLSQATSTGDAERIVLNLIKLLLK